jgi:thiamine-monophosphate kinase
MDSITICGTALGMVKKKEFMPRMGARNGDIICVTGELGSAGISLQNLKRGKDGEAVKKILLISPRIREGRAAVLTHGVTASMDISDGLASSLYQLLKINGVGFSVRAEKIPVDREAKFEKNAIDLAIYSGGDYELLFTVSPDMVDNVKKAVEGVGCKITDIGTVIKEKKVILLDGEVERRMENRGYEHFLSGGKTL